MEGVVDRDRLYSPKEAASVLGVTPYTVAKWVREGWLPGRRLGYKMVRIRGADIAAYLEAGDGAWRQPDVGVERDVPGG